MTIPPGDQALLAQLADRVAIVDVISNYATGLDARDWVLWRSVFVDEVVFDLSSWTHEPARRNWRRDKLQVPDFGGPSRDRTGDRWIERRA